MEVQFPKQLYHSIPSIKEFNLEKDKAKLQTLFSAFLQPAPPSVEKAQSIIDDSNKDRLNLPSLTGEMMPSKSDREVVREARQMLWSKNIYYFIEESSPDEQEIRHKFLVDVMIYYLYQDIAHDPKKYPTNV